MNTSRRLFLRAITTTVAAIPLLSSCPQQVKALTIASHSWPGYELLFLARREGWLSLAHVNLLETASATDSLQKLVAGEADGAALTLDEVLRARALGVALTCVLVFDVSAGADRVLSKMPLDNLAGLAGKRIGFEKSAVGSLMLHELLKAAKLERSAVIPVAVNYDQHLAVWNQNQVDVLVTFEPIASQLLERGAYKIFDSREIPNTIFDVLAVKTELINSHRQAIENLVSAHFQARQYLYHNAQDAAYKMTVRMKLSAQGVLDSFRGLNLPNEQANEKYLSGQHSHLLVAAQTLSALMMEIGSIKQPDSLQTLVSADFLPGRS